MWLCIYRVVEGVCGYILMMVVSSTVPILKKTICLSYTWNMIWVKFIIKLKNKTRAHRTYEFLHL